MKKHLLTFWTLLGAIYFSTLTLSAQTVLPYTSCDCTTGPVSAGTPVPPATTTFILGETLPSDLATTPTGSGVPNYAFVYSNPDGTVLELSDDGTFDFNGYPEGVYGVTGFAYDQAQLTQIVGLVTTLCSIPGQTTVPAAVCAAIATMPSPPGLGDFFALINSFGGGTVTVPSLVHTMDSIVCVSSVAGLVNACFSVTESPSYSITVVGDSPVTWDECEGAISIDLAAGVSGPYNSQGLTAGGEGLPSCFFDSSVENTGWISFVGDGGSYFIYSSPECAGGVNLDTEGTYLPFGDTQIAVYSGDCGTLNEIACNEDAQPYGSNETGAYGYYAGVTVETEVGVTYYAMIDGYEGEAGQFCLHSIPASCPNIDLAAGTPSMVELCDGESFGLSADFTTLTPGIITINNPIALWVVSTEALDATIGAEFNSGVVIEFLGVDTIPTLFNGNAAGVYTAGDDTTYSTIWVTGIVANNITATGSLSFDPACAAEYSASVQIVYYPAGSPACTVVETPANDDCANAFTLDITDGAINGPYTNNGATGEGDLPAGIVECFGDYENGGAAHDSYDNTVWFMFVGDGSTVTLTTDTIGVTNPIEDGDTQLAVFAGACDGEAVGCSDDIDFDNNNYASTVTIETVAGTTYYVVVDGFFTGDGFYPEFHSNGNFNISVSSTGAPEPLSATATVTTYPLDNNYIVSFVVSGGVGPYTYSGAVNSTSDIFGTSFDSNYITCGETYTLTIVDAEGTTFTLSDVVICGAEPLVVNVTGTSYSSATNSYVVSFAASGGTSPYNATGSAGVLSAGDGLFVSEGILCGTGYSFTVTDAAGQVATISGNAPAECNVTPTCDASFGTITAPANTTYTVGGTSGLIGVNGAATGDYTTVFAITDGLPELNIVGLSTSNPIDFSALTIGGSLPAGTYTVHALNILNSDIATAVGAVTGGLITTGFQAADAIAAGIICAELDVTGFEITLENTANDVVITYTIDCDNTSGEYTVTFNVSGGDGGPYNYAGVLSGSSADLGTTLTTSPIADGNGFSFVATDNSGNSTTVSEASVACTKCEFSAGDMSDETHIACGGDALQVAGAFGVIDTDGAFIYALHTASGETAGTILAVDNNTADGANFSFNASNMQYGTTYYVSSVVGPDEDLDGSPDLTSECTKVAAGTPVIFNAPIGVMWNITCDETTKRGTVVLHVSGGTGGYEVSGNLFNGTYTPPSMTTIDVTTGFYSVFVTDANGCTGSIADSIDCKKPTVVTWREFTGEVLSNGNLLKWTTAMEYDNNYFMVQRSLDGNTFETIATIQSKGNSNTATSYSSLDQNAPQGTAYYQIVQVDLDGKQSSTEIISLTRGEADFGIVSISPVPALNDIDVIFTSNNANSVSIAIYDAAGRNVMNSNSNGIAGVNTVNINVSNLAAGTYFVKVNDGNTVSVSKFVK